MSSYQTLVPKEVTDAIKTQLLLPKVSTASGDVKASSPTATIITPETPQKPITILPEAGVTGLDHVSDIAKEALRITKESLGSRFQLVPRGE